MIKFTKEKNNHFYLLQIDQEKAFDKVDGNFLFKSMQKLGISPLFINFIKTLYTNNKSTMINNGFLSSPISLERGLRQGCPLSLPLYIIQGEVTAKSINKNYSIIGIKIRNYKNQIKISQYTDDSNFFLKKQDSITDVLNFFEILKKATGATINLEKAILLPINTDITLQIQTTNPRFSIKEQYESIKILRILINEDLKLAKQTNWQNTIEKIENHINKLTPRILPLQGKVILLNTLILSKTSHLSNIFPLDANKTSKIHKTIFKYLWNNSNTEPIARKTIFLKKKQGGLNLIEPESQNFAMRIKHLLKFKQKR